VPTPGRHEGLAARRIGDLDRGHRSFEVTQGVLVPGVLMACVRRASVTAGADAVRAEPRR